MAFQVYPMLNFKTSDKCLIQNPVYTPTGIKVKLT